MPQNNDSGRSGISGMSDRRSLVIPNDVFFRQVAETLAGGSPVTFIVKGYSMYPFMRNGKDSVCLEWYDGRALSAGEVILFQYRGKHVLHRIYKTEAAPDGAMLYRTMGDGNLRGMETALPHSVLGVMTKRITPSGKEWGCNTFSWHLASWLWMRLFRVRRWLLAVLRRLYR